MHLMKGYEDKIMYGDSNISNNDWPKENPYLRTAKTIPEKLFANSFYGKSIFEWKDYCEHDTKITKEIMNSMNKIKNVGLDPRKHCSTSNIYAVINGKAYIPEAIEVRNGFREHTEFEFSVSSDPRYAAMNTMFSIKDVIFNPPATIVFWGDGSKTVVKCQNGEEFDPEKGLTMAFFKRMHDNKGHYFEEIKKWTNRYYEKYPIGDDGVTIEIHGKDWIDIFNKIKNTLNPLFTNNNE